MSASGKIKCALLSPASIFFPLLTNRGRAYFQDGALALTYLLAQARLQSDFYTYWNSRSMTPWSAWHTLCSHDHLSCTPYRLDSRVGDLLSTSRIGSQHPLLKGLADGANDYLALGGRTRTQHGLFLRRDAGLAHDLARQAAHLLRRDVGEGGACQCVSQGCVYCELTDRTVTDKRPLPPPPAPLSGGEDEDAVKSGDDKDKEKESPAMVTSRTHARRASSASVGLGLGFNPYVYGTCAFPFS